MLNIFLSWLTLIFIDTFLVKDFPFFIDNFSERFAVNFGLSSLGLLLVLIIFSRFKKTIFLLFLIPTIIQATYFEIYKKLVTPFGFQTFAEDYNLVLSLWLENLNFWKTSSILIIFMLLFKYFKPQKFGIWIKATASFFLIGIYSLIVLSWYSIPNFQNSIISYYGTFLETVRLGFYQKNSLNRPKLQAKNRQNLPNIIFIVGESLVLNHTSLFGYERDTTPNLKQLEKDGQIVKFENAVSIGTKTRLSVPYMLVGLTGIDPKGKIYNYPTIMNYAKSVGYETSFITAQDLSWGGLKDFLIDKSIDNFVNGTKYNSNARVHKGADDLVVVENEILPIFQKKAPFFIVYQMDGNHYPYSKHSPEIWKRWKENGANSVNAYDNSVLYSDFSLSKIIKQMRLKFPNSWIFYSTDHGQNLGGKSGMYNDNFSLDVIHNTFFISPPKKYLADLQKLKNSPISQADIVPTILDILKIKPIKKLDGISLLKKISDNRLRIVSTFMPTLHNSPEAVLVFPDLKYFSINFSKMSVVLKDGKTAIPFQELEEKYKKLFK